MEFKSFTSAVIKDDEVRKAVGKALEDNLRKGEGQRPFSGVVNDIFDKKGLTKLNPYQINTIYKTNASLAYSAGQLDKFAANKTIFPYWKYSATQDSKTRPGHLALHGKIYKNGDFRYWPPIDFNCRCSTIPQTARMVKGKTIEVSKGIELDEKNSFTGNKHQVFYEWLSEKYKEVSPWHQNLLKEVIEVFKKSLDSTPNF